MRRLFWALGIAGVVMWIAGLQRRLRAAQMRGDMYRDIAARLDRQLVELAAQGR
jgi:hypothetical protein